jgi:hypothetical protein
MKVGDTKPALTATLLDITKKQLYESTVTAKVRHKGTSSIVVNSQIDEKNADEKQVTYLWTDDGSDLSQSGTYQVEFEVEYQDGTTEHFPSDGYLTFDVEQPLTDL